VGRHAGFGSYLRDMTRQAFAVLSLLGLTLSCPAQHTRKPAAAPPADTPAASAASQPTDIVKVDKISYTGTGAKDYSPTDFATVTGLAPGNVVYGDIQKGADTLANSGQFGGVEFAMDGNTLVFKITAATTALPVHFENFAWWSELDLLRHLHGKFPLFVDELGGKGELLDKLQAELTAMATEKAGPGAKVEMSMLARPGEPPYAVAFLITSPAITIGRVVVPGSMDVSSMLAGLEEQMVGKPYNRDHDKELLSSRLAEAYGAEGYIDFRLKGFEATDPRPGASGFSVTLRGTPEPGQLYHVASITWTETPVFSQAQFDAASKLKVGDVAALGPLEATLHFIERAYQAQGYVNAKATATPTLDHEHGTVSYVVSVEPGAVFHTDGV
jgi:outer membrane protein assembly factor BamA